MIARFVPHFGERGIYDCAGSSTGNYVNSVKIKRDNKYLWASGRDGAKLLDPTPGSISCYLQ